MKTFLKILCVIMAISSLSFCLAACSGAEKYDTEKTGEGIFLEIEKVKSEINSMKVSDFAECKKSSSDYILIKVKDYGEIVVVLREDVAPITVKNFKKLVQSGFFSGTIFHRIIEDFMIQGGGYVIKDGKQVEKNVSSIKGEFSENGFANPLYHVRGVISMARTNEPNSASSQFFIMHQTTPSLDRKYAAFGYVLAGMEVVDAIATCEVSGESPVENIVIESITFVQPAN